MSISTPVDAHVIGSTTTKTDLIMARAIDIAKRSERAPVGDRECVLRALDLIRLGIWLLAQVQGEALDLEATENLLASMDARTNTEPTDEQWDEHLDWIARNDGRREDRA